MGISAGSRHILWIPVTTGIVLALNQLIPRFSPPRITTRMQPRPQLSFHQGDSPVIYFHHMHDTLRMHSSTRCLTLACSLLSIRRHHSPWHPPLWSQSIRKQLLSSLRLRYRFTSLVHPGVYLSFHFRDWPQHVMILRQLRGGSRQSRLRLELHPCPTIFQTSVSRNHNISVVLVRGECF